MILWKRKGFTLIEVLITVSILILLIGILFPFFNSNFKTLNEVKIRQDLQTEGEKVLEMMTTNKNTNILECKGIIEIKDENGMDRIKSSITTGISTMVFESTQGQNKGFKLENNILYYGRGTAFLGKTEVAKYITSIDITPTGKAFDVTKGIHLRINLQEGRFCNTVESEIAFRNHR